MTYVIRQRDDDEILFSVCRLQELATARFLSGALESSIIQLTSGRIWRAEIESFGLALATGVRRGSTGTRQRPRVSELRNQITGYR